MLKTLVVEKEGFDYLLTKVIEQLAIAELEINTISGLNNLQIREAAKYDLIIVVEPDLRLPSLRQMILETPLSYWVCLLEQRGEKSRQSLDLGFALNLYQPFDENLLTSFLHTHNYKTKGGLTAQGVPRSKSELIGVWSAQGGVGKTSLALNLGAKLVALKKTPCLLAEIKEGTGLSFFNQNQEFWNLGDLLNLEGDLSLSDLQFLSGRQDGLGILSYGENDYTELSARNIAEVGKRLRSSTLPFILDGLSGCDSLTLAWLRECTKVIIVVSSEEEMIEKVSSMWKRVLGLMPTRPECYVVINNLHEDYKVDLSQVKDLFKAERSFSMPNDYKTIYNIWRRKSPWGIRDKKTRWFSSLDQIAKVL